MAGLNIDNMIAKHKKCVGQLDADKTCASCKYSGLEVNDEPCCDCFAELLGMPVNPTQWESR